MKKCKLLAIIAFSFMMDNQIENIQLNPNNLLFIDSISELSHLQGYDVVLLRTYRIINIYISTDGIYAVEFSKSVLNAMELVLKLNHIDNYKKENIYCEISDLLNEIYDRNDFKEILHDPIIQKILNTIIKCQNKNLYETINDNIINVFGSKLSSSIIYSKYTSKQLYQMIQYANSLNSKKILYSTLEGVYKITSTVKGTSEILAHSIYYYYYMLFIYFIGSKLMRSLLNLLYYCSGIDTLKSKINKEHDNFDYINEDGVLSEIFNIILYIFNNITENVYFIILNIYIVL